MHLVFDPPLLPSQKRTLNELLAALKRQYRVNPPVDPNPYLMLGAVLNKLNLLKNDIELLRGTLHPADARQITPGDIEHEPD